MTRDELSRQRATCSNRPPTALTTPTTPNGFRASRTSSPTSPTPTEAQTTAASPASRTRSTTWRSADDDAAETIADAHDHVTEYRSGVEGV